MQAIAVLADPLKGSNIISPSQLIIDNKRSIKRTGFCVGCIAE